MSNYKMIQKLPIYKLLLKNDLDKFKLKRIFYGTKLDLQSKFIHLSSNKEQYQKVINKYFNKDDDIYVLYINSSNLKNLKYEPNSAGELFPHLYEALQYKDVIKVEKYYL